MEGYWKSAVAFVPLMVCLGVAVACNRVTAAMAWAANGLDAWRRA